MEALGVAASVIAVIQISAQVIRTCTHFIEAVSDAPKDLRVVLIEVSALKGLFEPLKVLVGHDSDTNVLNAQLAGPVNGCLAAISELDGLLCPDELLYENKLGDGEDGGGGGGSSSSSSLEPSRAGRRKRQKFHSVLARLAWPLKQDRAKRLLGLIGVYKSTINLLLTSNGLIEFQTIKQDLKSVRVVLDDAVKARILNWLVTVNPSINHNAALDLLQEGTCGWVVESSEWKAWKRKIRRKSADGSRGIWIHGIPGAGKTILSAFLAQRLIKFCESDDLGDAEERELWQADDESQDEDEMVGERSSTPPWSRLQRKRRRDDGDEELSDSDSSTLKSRNPPASPTLVDAPPLGSASSDNDQETGNFGKDGGKADNTTKEEEECSLSKRSDDTHSDVEMGGIEHEQERALPKASAYYYCYHGRRHEETPHFLRWLLNQLCRQADDIPEELANLFQLDRQPQVGDLLEAVLDIASRFSHVFISIDAVDESQNRDSLAALLQQMATEERFGNIYILVTSRREVEIEHHLAEFLSLSMSNPLVDRDITKYIDAKLRKERAFQRWSPSLRKEAKQVLVDGANGMFRWATCQLDTLKKLHLESAVRRALNQLPETLDDTYERIFTSIPPESAQYVWRTMAFLLCVDSVPVDVLVGFLSRRDSEDDIVEERLSPEAIQEIMSCLVTITYNHTSVLDQKEKLLRLSHYTIREYLAAPRVAQSKASMFYLPDSQAMSYLLRVVLQSFLKPRSGHAMAPDAFQRYAEKEWPALLLKGDTVIASDDDLSDAVFRLLDPREPSYQHIVAREPRIRSRSHELADDIFSGPEELHAKYEIVIFTNLVYTNLYATTTTFLLRRTPKELAELCTTDVIRGDNLTLLGWLARYHYDNYLLLALERTAEFPDLRTPLLVWALETYTLLKPINVTVNILIAASTPVNPARMRVTPLQIAVRALRIEDVRLLLDKGADPNAVGDPAGWTTHRLKHFEGGESPLLIVRQQRRWLESGQVSPWGWARYDGRMPMNEIEQALVEAGGREFCTWNAGRFPMPTR